MVKEIPILSKQNMIKHGRNCLPLSNIFLDSAYHLPEEEANLPRIPVQPISYEDAGVILG